MINTQRKSVAPYH